MVPKTLTTDSLKMMAEEVGFSLYLLILFIISYLVYFYVFYWVLIWVLNQVRHWVHLRDFT